MTLRRRVERLEDRVPVADGWQPYRIPTPEENEAVREKLAAAIEKAGPRRVVPDDELWANMQAVKADLAAAAAEYEAAHEWRWVDGQCYVRKRPVGRVGADGRHPAIDPP